MGKVMILNRKNLHDNQLAYWFIFTGDRIAAYSEQPQPIQATWQELSFVHHYEDAIVEIGEYQSFPCYAIDLRSEQPDSEAITTHSLRSYFLHGHNALFALVARAWQLVLFLRTHQFCGQCGSRMRQIEWELATACDTCGHRCYPRISPCIIVAIRKGDSLLLAQGPSQRERKMHSTLAGFVESGESLEQAVHREVMEEVGIRIRNLEYFGSQPWPFPHSLMVGYLAEYESGSIQVDGKEILEADWYTRETMPFTPPPLSIAGKLIEETLRRIDNDRQ